MRAPKVIVAAVQKGGGSKSTLTVHGAALSDNDGVRSIGFDADEQQLSAVNWSERRQLETPPFYPVNISNLRRAVESAKQQGYEAIWIDSPHHVSPINSEIARLADLYVIPIKPSPFELERAKASADLARAAGKEPYFLLTRCNPQQKTQNTKAEQYLRQFGSIIPVRISSLVAYEQAIFSGKSVTEFQPQGRAADEMRALWQWEKQHLWPNHTA